MAMVIGGVLEAMQLMAHGSLADMRRVYHPDAVNREAASEPPAARRRGPEGFYATALWLRSAFEDLRFTVDDVVAQDDVVVTYGSMSGRQAGDFTVFAADGSVQRAFAPTGREFSARQAHFHRMRDGLVAEHWAVRDDQGMALQLGWVPPTPLYLLRCALATQRARRVPRSGRLELDQAPLERRHHQRISSR
jgi:predicted ester cyclase